MAGLGHHHQGKAVTQINSKRLINLMFFFISCLLHLCTCSLASIDILVLPLKMNVLKVSLPFKIESIQLVLLLDSYLSVSVEVNFKGIFRSCTVHMYSKFSQNKLNIQ